jgi:hypothetical protein
LLQERGLLQLLPFHALPEPLTAIAIEANPAAGAAVSCFGPSSTSTFIAVGSSAVSPAAAAHSSSIYQNSAAHASLLAALAGLEASGLVMLAELPGPLGQELPGAGQGQAPPVQLLLSPHTLGGQVCTFMCPYVCCGGQGMGTAIWQGLILCQLPFLRRQLLLLYIIHCMRRQLRCGLVVKLCGAVLAAISGDVCAVSAQKTVCQPACALYRSLLSRTQCLDLLAPATAVIPICLSV